MYSSICRQNSHDCQQQHFSHEKNSIEIDQKALLSITEQICQPGGCRYPLLALRILIHVIGGIDGNGQIPISARRLSKSMNVHYDTVCKTLKYLRKTGVLEIER